VGDSAVIRLEIQLQIVLGWTRNVRVLQEGITLEVQANNSRFTEVQYYVSLTAN
jgi:hypothetical protein